LFETICQIRGDELDGAGTHELVHHIRGGEATPDERDLGSFTHRKLKQLPIRDLWLFSKWKQLDTHQDQNIFGVRCPIPPGITVLRSQVQFSQPYASCIDQPCTRLFLALSAAMSFVVMGADCTNAYASAPSPHRLANRHTLGLTMPTPTGIALAMEKKLTARWCYQVSMPRR
jgi:hypothetical protein